MTKKFWLMKSEPDTYSIDHLQKDQSTWWEGVRNYQARNFMAKEMNVGDEVLFYHSSTNPPGVAGRAVISKKAKADQSQFNKKSDHFDPKATQEKPIWFCTEVQFKEKFKNLITLEQIKADEKLKNMVVIQRGSRLSIQPVTEADYNHLLNLSQKK
jgi:predicted RNA-binding protein with PUA-like domain